MQTVLDEVSALAQSTVVPLDNDALFSQLDNLLHAPMEPRAKLLQVAALAVAAIEVMDNPPAIPL